MIRYRWSFKYLDADARIHVVRGTMFIDRGADAKERLLEWIEKRRPSLGHSDIDMPPSALPHELQASPLEVQTQVARDVRAIIRVDTVTCETRSD